MGPLAATVGKIRRSDLEGQETHGKKKNKKRKGHGGTAGANMARKEVHDLDGHANVQGGPSGVKIKLEKYFK